MDTDTGEVQEKRLGHREEAENFYRALAAAGQKVRVGMEASGHARWFERLPAELNFELWIGDAAVIRTTSHGLSIAEASDSDIQKVCSLQKSLSLDHGRKLFIVQGTDFVGHVTALLVACHEDEGEYHEPSFFAPKALADKCCYRIIKGRPS